jgi:hypothetical protein
VFLSLLRDGSGLEEKGKRGKGVPDLSPKHVRWLSRIFPAAPKACLADLSFVSVRRFPRFPDVTSIKGSVPSAPPLPSLCRLPSAVVPSAVVPSAVPLPSLCRPRRARHRIRLVGHHAIVFTNVYKCYGLRPPARVPLRAPPSAVPLPSRYTSSDCPHRSPYAGRVGNFPRLMVISSLYSRSFSLRQDSIAGGIWTSS